MEKELEVIDVSNWNKISEYLYESRHPQGLQDKHKIINPEDNNTKKRLQVDKNPIKTSN